MTIFPDELEIFRIEEEIVQQYFFAYLGQRDLLAKRSDLLRVVNENSLFWAPSHHALIMSTFIALGRIFDDKSKHGLDKLRRVVEMTWSDFTTASLQIRRADLGAYAQEYVKDKHGMTQADWRPIAYEIDYWTATYENVYKPIRHQFAHKKLSTLNQVNALLAKTNIDEMKAMCAFLHSLHYCLRELWINGRKPVLEVRDFILPPPDSLPANNRMLGEKVYHEAQRALLQLVVEPTA
jgi:hypothetical protein